MLRRGLSWCGSIAAISPAAARALLEALQPLAAGHDAIRVVVQHDPELNRTLAEAGSQVTLEFVHYRGTLLES